MKVLISRSKQRSPLVTQTGLSLVQVETDEVIEKTPVVQRSTGVTCILLDAEMMKLNHAADVNELQG